MMDLIIDANILFAALVKDGASARLILHERIHLYAPEFILDEFEKYRSVLLEKTHRSDEEYDRVLSIFKKRITLIPKEELSSRMLEAESVSPDKEDSPYIAASLEIGAALWTNDLQHQKQAKVHIMTTKQLLEIFPEDK